MKRLLTIAMAAFCGVLLAEDVTVSTVEDLVKELTRLNGSASNVIRLEPRDYVLPDGPMYDDTNGKGAIYVNRVKLIGLGEKPEQVRLVGNGKIRAVYSSSGWLENLMITNGFASGTSTAGRGGGVYGASTITNCVIAGCEAVLGGAVSSCSNLLDARFEGNSAGNGGAFHNATTMIGCTFKNNVATGSGTGGAGYQGAVLTARDCDFISNSAASGGAFWQQDKTATFTNCVFAGNSASKTPGGGAVNGRVNSTSSQVQLLGCIITNNTAEIGNGGGCCSHCTVRGGVVAGNTAGGNGGGLYNVSAFDRCVISNNFANGDSGGGAYFSEGGYTISNCLVYANRSRCSTTSSAHGGGVHCSSSDVWIIDTEVTGNYSMNANGRTGQTGGVYKGTLIGGSVHDNYADSDGGGCREVVAIGCHIYNNDCGGTGKNGYMMDLVGCDVADNAVASGSARDTVFHDIGGERTLTNNPFKVGHTYTPTGVWDHHMNATNCLFYGNKVDSLFLGTTAGGVRASLVNCTVVSNAMTALFNTFSDGSNPLRIVNCAFVGNTNKGGDKQQDVSFNATGVTVGGMSLAYCIYGTTSVTTLSDYAEDQAPLYQLGKNGIASSPRFNTEGKYPYEPRCSSPLVGRGRVMVWMAGAYDIRGDIDDGKYLRLRDGKADIGCYQCWLEPNGLMLLLR